MSGYMISVHYCYLSFLTQSKLGVDVAIPSLYNESSLVIFPCTCVFLLVVISHWSLVMFTLNLHEYYHYNITCKWYFYFRVMLLHSKLFADARSQSLGALNKTKFNFYFIFKSLMYLHPVYVMVVLITSIFLIGSWALRLVNRPETGGAN